MPELVTAAHREVVGHVRDFRRWPSAARPSGQRLDDDYDLLEDGIVVGRIFCLNAVGPQAAPGCRRAPTTATSNRRARI